MHQASPHVKEVFPVNLHCADWRPCSDTCSSKAREFFLVHPSGLLWRDLIRVTARLCLVLITIWHKPGRAASIHEGCSKIQPQGGEGESEASGLLGGWEITALALMLKQQHIPAQGCLFSIKPLQCPFANPLPGSVPRVSDILAGLWEGSMCQLWAAAKLQTRSSAEGDAAILM